VVDSGAVRQTLASALCASNLEPAPRFACACAIRETVAVRQRVIFIATPHRGSFLAGNPIAKIGNKFLNLPGNITR
jgi:hypothetical protein